MVRYGFDQGEASPCNKFSALLFLKPVTEDLGISCGDLSAALGVSAWLTALAYVAVCFFILPMLGIALLGSGWAYPVPLISAALCGAGIGAEIDLMAFFISHYFGLKS